MDNLHPSEEQLRSAYAFVRSHPFPAMPDVVRQISLELAQPDPELSRLIELINSDVAMAGLVLKTINSAAIGFHDIESVQQAVTLLGLNRIRHLIIASYVERALPLQSAYAQQVLKDSKLVAQAATLVAQELQVVAPDEAYIAGLMLDCGAIFLSEYLGETYEPIHDLQHGHPMSIARIEDRRIGTNHAEVGYLFARHWKLPETVCLALHLHHQLSCGQVEDAELRGLLAVLSLADYLAAKVSGAVTLESSVELVQHLVGVKTELMIDDARLDEFEQILSSHFDAAE